MIPLFPNFKSLELNDKLDIEKITSRFPPYSDFNFVSLWSWDTADKIQIAELTGNLVVKFQDYLNNELFYSFIGSNNIIKTTKTLLTQAKKEKIHPNLKLISENSIKSIGTAHQYNIKEDKDNFDYILSVQELTEMKGNKYRAKRNFINRFISKYNSMSKIVPINITSRADQNQLIKLFYRWEKSSGRTRKETANELKAIRKLFKGAHNFKLESIGIIVDNQLVGFSINEIVHHDHGIIHFEKADISYVGIFQYLKQQTAIELSKYGCKFINYEQDMGIEGLRKAKLSYNPLNYLKKFIIFSN